MLIDDVYEKQSKFTLPNGYKTDDALVPLRRRLSRAEVFAFDRNAVAMAANVALSRPTSILSALPWVRLPFDLTWLEMANADLREAMADLGSPNEPPPHAVTTIERSGFLMQQQEDGEILIDYVHRDRSREGKQITDLAPVRLRFLPEGIVPDELPDLTVRALPAQARSKMRDYLRLLTDDPEQLRAERNVQSRIDWEPHPDLITLTRGLEMMMGTETVRQTEKGQAEEACRLFKVFALPALILLNCRNAIETEKVKPAAAHNKQRRLRGKKPLITHNLVKVKLSQGQQRRVGQGYGGDRDRFIRGTLVSGHFKVRKTGIFWWSPHPRRGWGAVTKTRVVTA